MKFDANTLLALVAGLATAIPLVIKLVQYIEKAIREKNWSAMLEILLSLMAQAEINFDNGADRKTWVMSELEKLSYVIHYDLDMNAISTLIDSLCDMSKKVNAPIK